MIYIGKREYKLGRMKMSHMVSDSLEELHTFAEELGIGRKHFQDKRKPHYDICKSKKQVALKRGAFEVDDRTLILVLRGDMKLLDELDFKFRDQFNKEFDKAIFLGICPRYITL